MRAILLVLLLWPAAVTAQIFRDDPATGAALAQALGVQSLLLDHYLLTNHPDAATATEAVGMVYSHIAGSAGSSQIDIGLFRRVEGGFVLAGRIQQIYGFEPRDVAFLPDRIMLTTTTLRDGDGRCCPTGTTVWTISRATLSAWGVPQ